MKDETFNINCLLKLKYDIRVIITWNRVLEI